jgi:site-specific DNA recombinase
VFDSYGRLSWNPTTRELEKIETQHADNKKTIKRHGGVLGEPLDDGVTAWKTGVRRPGFETLLERARTGASQGIAVWHVDRLFRQPRDLERLIDLADSGFRVISSHGTADATGYAGQPTNITNALRHHAPRRCPATTPTQDHLA